MTTAEAEELFKGFSHGVGRSLVALRLLIVASRLFRLSVISGVSRGLLLSR